MKLTADTLPKQLAERLLPVYLVTGDEPLLSAEALDAIRTRARVLGFEEREQVFIDKTAAAWQNAVGATQTQSLFATRRILEIRMASARPGPGAASLLKLIAAAGEDLLLVIGSPKLDRESQGAQWVRAAQERGALVSLWPPDAAQFPEWLHRRLRGAGLDVPADGVTLLVEAAEGNLLAAQQEIDKLVLRFGAGARLSREQLMDAFGDSARFEVTGLTQAVAAGNAARALRVLAGLRAEGDEPVRILWWLVRSIRGLATGSRNVPMGRLIARASRVDRVAKGQAHGDAWDELALLTAEMCGRRTLPLPRHAVVWERAKG